MADSQDFELRLMILKKECNENKSFFENFKKFLAEKSSVSIKQLVLKQIFGKCNSICEKSSMMWRSLWASIAVKVLYERHFLHTTLQPSMCLACIIMHNILVHITRAPSRTS